MFENIKISQLGDGAQPPPQTPPPAEWKNEHCGRTTFQHLAPPLCLQVENAWIPTFNPMENAHIFRVSVKSSCFSISSNWIASLVIVNLVIVNKFVEVSGHLNSFPNKRVSYCNNKVTNLDKTMKWFQFILLSNKSVCPHPSVHIHLSASICPHPSVRIHLSASICPHPSVRSSSRYWCTIVHFKYFYPCTVLARRLWSSNLFFRRVEILYWDTVIFMIILSLMIIIRAYER